MSKGSKIIGGGLVVGALALLAYLKLGNKSKAFDRLKFNIVSVHLVPWPNWYEYLTKGFKLKLKVNIINPTNEAFWLKQIIADGYVDSRNIGNINTTKSVFIPRNQETLIDLESRVPAVGLSQSLLTIFKDFLYKGKPVMIKIAGYSDFGTIKVPFEQIIPLQKQTNAQ